MHIVKLEALYWCKTAVSIGVIVGIVGTWMLCALLRFGAVLLFRLPAIIKTPAAKTRTNKIAELRKTYGFTDETLSENTALLGLTGFSSDSYVMGMYLVAAILFVLVLAAGVFMIAGSLNSRTAERTQFFG